MILIIMLGPRMEYIPSLPLCPLGEDLLQLPIWRVFVVLVTRDAQPSLGVKLLTNSN